MQSEGSKGGLSLQNAPYKSGLEEGKKAVVDRFVVSRSVRAKCHIRPRCLEALAEAVLLSVSRGSRGSFSIGKSLFCTMRQLSRLYPLQTSIH